MLVLRLLLVAALALPGVGVLAGRPVATVAHTLGAAPAATVARPAGGSAQEAVLEEVAVAVAPVVDGEAGEAAPAEGSGSPDLQVTAEDVVGGTVTTDVVESAGFGVVGLTWPDGADVESLRPQVRVRTAEGWSEWVDVEVADDGPDAGTPDDAGAREGSDPVVVGDADAVQARFAATDEGGPEGLALALVDPDRPADAVDAAPTVSGEQPGDAPRADAVADLDATEPVAVAEAAALLRPTSRAARLADAATAVPATAPRPAVVTRAQWGADESLRAVNPGCETPSYASTVVGAAIHHTATSNSYATQAAAMSAIRGIQAYHVLGRGWCDIGYNFLVDTWGTIYEGRSGGMERAVIGVHTGGFNTRTVGISMLGDYSATAPSAAMREAVARVVAWRLGAYHRDPTGSMTYYTYGGQNSKVPANTSITLPVVFPHRQVAYTSCPGDGGMQVLSWIRYRARQLIGTNLVGPALTASEVGVGQGVDLWSGAWGSVGWRLTMKDRHGSTVWNDSGVVTDGAIHSRWSGRDPHGSAYPVGSYAVTLDATDRRTGAALPTFTTTLVVAPPVNPFGQLDSVRVAPGRVEASGWAIDPDTSDPIIVQVYVDGAGYTMGWASAARPDVGAAYPSAGPNHGYTLGLVTAPGTRTVCAYAVNVGRGSSQRIGCRKVVVPSASPFGQIDRVAAGAGRVTVSGWVIDPDAGGPTIVQMWLDGRTYTMGWASRSRPDVAVVYPWAGAEHGYELSLPAGRGTHTVCVPAVNAGQGSSVSLGCRRVTVP